MRVFVAFDALHLRKFVQQVLARGRASGLCLCFVVLKQRAAGCATDQDGELLFVQLQQLPKRTPGLQGESAQPHGKSAAHSAHRVGQRVHDLCVGQRFAAAGGRHVDDEGTVRGGALALRGCQVGGFILPAKGAVPAALAQQAVALHARQVHLKARQGARRQLAVLGHADQVLVQRLEQRAGLAIGIGVELAPRRDLGARSVLGIEAGIVVVGQHQAHARDVHHIRVGQPIALSGLDHQHLQTPGQLGGVFLPGGAVHG